MIVAVPFPFEVTRPADDTVARVISDEVQVTVAPGITVPPASFTVAVSVAVSASDVKVSESLDSAKLDAT